MRNGTEPHSVLDACMRRTGTHTAQQSPGPSLLLLLLLLLLLCKTNACFSKRTTTTTATTRFASTLTEAPPGDTHVLNRREERLTLLIESRNDTNYTLQPRKARPRPRPPPVCVVIIRVTKHTTAKPIHLSRQLRWQRRGNREVCRCVYRCITLAQAILDPP